MLQSLSSRCITAIELLVVLITKAGFNSTESQIVHQSFTWLKVDICAQQFTTSSFILQCAKRSSVFGKTIRTVFPLGPMALSLQWSLQNGQYLWRFFGLRKERSGLIPDIRAKTQPNALGRTFQLTSGAIVNAIILRSAAGSYTIEQNKD